MGVVDKIAAAAAKVGSKLVQPQDDSASELGAKQANLDEYTNSLKAAPAKIAPIVGGDKTHPKAKFGSRPGEKRLDPMGNELPSYKAGTAHVPKTGPAMLHKGEAVIPAKENPVNMFSKITEADRKPTKKLHEVRTRKAKGGSFIHEHHYSSGHPMEEHTSANKDAMIAHMQEHMGTESEGPKEQASEPTGAEAQEQALGM